jgi:hypothetical protein
MVYVSAGVLSVRAQAGSSGSSSSDAGGSAATLAAHRTWLRRQRVLHTEPHPSDGDIIELNIGGSVMVASRSTLRQVRINIPSCCCVSSTEQVLLPLPGSN